MFTTTYLDSVVAEMTRHDVTFSPGLSDVELASLENSLSVKFPEDFAAFLKHAVPIGKRFPAWRGSEQALHAWIRRPLDGLLYDVEFNAFWSSSWGDRPDDLRQAFDVLTEHFDSAPALLPIYMHRFIPTEPPDTGNPVFSVHQSDIIVFGNDLSDYLNKEFRVPIRKASRSAARRVRFWSDLVDLNAE